MLIERERTTFPLSHSAGPRGEGLQITREMVAAELAGV